ncbi:MAG: hypothetical protein R3C26_10885 [Calditrichia bacterium]
MLTAAKKWQKAIIALLIPFCLNLIILSNSRANDGGAGNWFAFSGIFGEENSNLRF